MVKENFTPGIECRWQRFLRGSGSLELMDLKDESTGHALRFINRDPSSEAYTNAQIDDYQGLPRSQFRWQPPLTLSVRARFSHPKGALSGTAGFGFWNDPFMMTSKRLPSLPRAIWFFYASPPSNLKLDMDVAGDGWKAAMIDAKNWRFLLLLPTVPFAVPLMHVRPVYHRLWRVGQRAIGVKEAPVRAKMTEWHTYVIEWGVDNVRFLVDGSVMLAAEISPQGPLGFVMWLDNQYAIVTPWGKFGYGLLGREGVQWMEVQELLIEPQRV